MAGSWQARSWPAGRFLRRRGWQTGTVVVCLIAGLLFGTARSFAHGRELRNRSVDLSVLVRGAQARVGVAQAAAAAVQAGIDAAAGSDVSPQVSKARASAAALAGPAALTPVAGPGLRVSLSDAGRNGAGEYPAGVDPDDLVVHQQDVQSVVNALWAGGAEAMMIMDQRVVTTSAVRCIGNTLLLQGRTYSPPFVITAIGDAATMSRALQAEPGVGLFLRYVAQFKLGFDAKPLADVTLPGYRGLIRLTAAHQESR